MPALSLIPYDHNNSFERWAIFVLFVVVFCRLRLMDFLHFFLITKRGLLDMKLLISWVSFIICKTGYRFILSFSNHLLRMYELSISQSDCWFLVAYLIGLPILGYSLDIGKEHVNLVDERLQKLLYSGQLDEKELDRWKVEH